MRNDTRINFRRICHRENLFFNNDFRGLR